MIEIREHVPDLGEDQDEKQSRQVSRFSFPYYDLESSIEVARQLHEKAGGKASLIQLASYLGNKDEFSGAFRAKLWGAQMFGLVDIRGKEIWTTPLGEQAASMAPGTQRDVRMAEAFFNIPLFKEVYRRYESTSMPSSREGLKKALEVTFGVTPRRVSSAVKTLLQSAEQAGFRRRDPNRLIHPVPVGLIEQRGEEEEEPRDIHRSQTPEGGIDQRDYNLPAHGSAPASESLLLWGLFQRLPKPGSTWEETERDSWVAAAKTLFDLEYKKEAKKEPKPEE